MVFEETRLAWARSLHFQFSILLMYHAAEIDETTVEVRTVRERRRGRRGWNLADQMMGLNTPNVDIWRTF
jgi:hypothetical protein